MNRVNLNALKVFAVVARHGNLQLAAQELNLSRGAVSQRIKQLEIDLGVVLFVREPRGVSLTEAGRHYRTPIDEALAILETAFSDITGPSDRVTLHLGASTAAKWLMPRMNRFDAEFPKVSLRTEVHEQLLARGLGRNEIAIWPGQAVDRAPFDNTKRLADIQLVAVCSPGFPRPETPLDLETLLTLPLLQDGHRRWERLIGATAHDAGHKLLNFDRTALALDAAIGGHGIAIAPVHMIDNDVRGGQLVEVWVDPEPAEAQLFVSWPRGHIKQQTISRIVEWIVSEFEELPTLTDGKLST